MKRLLFTKLNWKRVVLDKWTYLEPEEEAAAAQAAANTDTDTDDEDDEFDEDGLDGIDSELMEAEYRFERMSVNEGFSDTFMGWTVVQQN